MIGIYTGLQEWPQRCYQFILSNQQTIIPKLISIIVGVLMPFNIIWEMSIAFRISIGKFKTIRRHIGLMSLSKSMPIQQEFHFHTLFQNSISRWFIQSYILKCLLDQCST